MSSSNPVARRPSGLTWIVAAATLGALLAVPLAAEAASAAKPMCFGQRATIVGTKGNDVIKGTKRADVIVSKGGNDVIFGGGGKDRICAGGGRDKVNGGVGADWISGGWGPDTIAGYRGDDKLFGDRGRDRLVGAAGNDRLNGGRGIDRCFQGAGTGAIKNCEKAIPAVPVTDPAVPVTDLAVSVSGPNNANSGEDVTFTVEVKNLGPSAVTYTLNLAQSSRKATCSAPDWAGNSAGALLASGASRDMDVVASCTTSQNGAKVIVDAEVSSVASDPDALNNVAQGKTNLKK